MSKAGNITTPVTIEPKNVYGIRSEVIGNIHFNLNQEVIYPVEGVLAFHDYVNDKQKFLKLPANTTPTIISINPARTLLAIVATPINNVQEQSKSIFIYDLINLKKQRSLQLPQNARNKSITRISFTFNSNGLVVLTDYPDEMLYILYFDRLSSVVEGRAGNTNRRGKANFISCHPHNDNLIAVCGEGVMKLMTKAEKGFTFNVDIKPDFNATSIAWVSSEELIVGTIQGMLVLYENTKRKRSFSASETETFDLEADEQFEEQTFQIAPPVVSKNQAVVCMTAFAKGLAFAIFNQVYVFEKISKSKYERKTILDIPTANYPEELYQITNMAINLKQDTVIVTTRHNQIYVGILIVPESLKTIRLEFKTLGELVHIDEILDICVCSWRPIIVTSSKDKTIRIWNYKTGKVELVKRFPIEVTVIELYASGLYAAVGFVDKVKIMQIFMNDLNLIKMYNFPNSKDIKFSYFGHLMATAYENSIAITSVFNLETLRTLKGHNGTVLTLSWARNDKSIFSGGADGALYQWDIETGNRLQEIVHTGTEYRALCIPNDPNCFYAASDSGVLRKIKDSKIAQEIQMPENSPLRDIAITRSDLVMFAATNGGHLYSVQLPLPDAPNEALTKFTFFNSALTKLRFSYDGTLLISSSASGTLVIWQLKNIEGKVASMDQDLLKSHEVLIPRQELEEKIDRIEMLEEALKQQASEFYQKQSMNVKNEEQQMADIHKSYCEALTELKVKNDENALRHGEELKQITAQIDELNSEHKIQMEKLSAQYSKRMQMEYQKFANLRENMLKIRDSYEVKLVESEKCLNDTVKALETDFKNQLEERQDLIRQLMKEMDNKKLEFTEFCKKVEIENDRNMIDCQIEYEKKVQLEHDETAQWKSQAEAHQLKYDNVKKECEILFEDVSKLKEQHFKTKSIIVDLQNDINDLQNDIVDRENAIVLKEKRFEEMLVKNEELEKYKQVLNHKINELKEQIEPREMQIVEKRKQITEMEQELNGLQKNNAQLELKLKELRDKCRSVNVELNQERARAKAARLCLTNICSEIYQLAEKLNSPDKLKEGVRFLFQKYSSDDALKNFSSIETQIQSNLQKQRFHIEKIMNGCKQKMTANKQKGNLKKISIENTILLEEFEKVCHENESIKKELKNTEILVNIVSHRKLDYSNNASETLVKTDEIDKYFKATIASLQKVIMSLLQEEECIKKELKSKSDMEIKSEL